MTYKPGYLKSLENGELQKKIIALRQHLEKCRLCSHMCEVNRIAGERGFCGAGVTLEVASSCVHMGEEPVLTGNTGVGNIFLGYLRDATGMLKAMHIHALLALVILMLTALLFRKAKST